MKSKGCKDVVKGLGLPALSLVMAVWWSSIIFHDLLQKITKITLYTEQEMPVEIFVKLPSLLLKLQNKNPGLYCRYLVIINE